MYNEIYRIMDTNYEDHYTPPETIVIELSTDTSLLQGSPLPSGGGGMPGGIPAEPLFESISN